MEMIELHRRALAAATEQVAAIRPGDLTRRTPCADWDLAALLAHMVGQNHGFAAALRHEQPGLDAFRPRPVGDAPLPAWTASAEDLAAAAATATDGAVHLPEISTERTFPVVAAVSMQLLDTVVHTWDVTTALGRTWRPADDLLAATADIARLVPDDESRTRPGAAFAPATSTDGADEWPRTLARLGRSAG